MEKKKYIKPEIIVFVLELNKLNLLTSSDPINQEEKLTITEGEGDDFVAE
jgi:hypothetical protein